MFRVHFEKNKISKQHNRDIYLSIPWVYNIGYKYYIELGCNMKKLEALLEEIKVKSNEIKKINLSEQYKLEAVQRIEAGCIFKAFTEKER